MKHPSQSNSPNWFSEHLSRRKLGKGLMWTAALSAAGLTLYKISDKDDPEISLDSLELQRKEGWNVGSTEKPLVFSTNPAATDSQGKTWGGLDPNYLISIYQPRDARWQPFFVPTLLQSLSQASLNNQIKPLRTGEMTDAYSRAEGLRTLIASSPNANQTLIISDLSGPASIAVGAALADAAVLVPVFDNWPHPLGVVPSHLTLGAAVYYRPAFQRARSARSPTAPPAFVLDRNRLAPYTDEESQFDNRYVAKLPTAENLRALGVRHLLYVTPSKSDLRELDDLNEEFVDYARSSIDVKVLPLTDFDPPPQAAAAAAPAHGYYYGGYPHTHLWFWNNYGWYTPRSPARLPSRAPAATLPAPSPPVNVSRGAAYRPVSRPTIFSSRTVGVGRGVGKQKPSGFGRVSVRASKSTGAITRVHTGRSGSFGRAGGASSS